jgi:uncharacterized protein involved in exopolysaccharide biosynthesis
MTIAQFFRILLARRWLIIASVAASLLGALLVVTILPARYTASSRIMLDIIKPDPVTGEVIGTQFVRAFTQTQTELIKDYKLVGSVIDELGWMNEPSIVEQFQDPADPDGTRRRLADLVIENTEAKLIEGSNILEITYSAPTPEAAKVVADALRRAYVDLSLSFKQKSSSEAADWYQAQTDKLRRQLALAEEKKSKFERENGVIMQADKSDVDSARLAALSQQMEAPTAPAVPMPAPVASAASMEVARLDAQIAQYRQSLGPNHPTLRGLQQQRSALASQAAQERSAASAANAMAARAANAGSGSTQRELAAQKSRVLANSEKLTALRQLQDQVDVLREQYVKAATRASELRLQGNVADAGLTPLGDAVAPEDPAFPNMPLIIGGSIAFGLMLGILAGLLTELLSRRVRSGRDLEDAAKAPLLAVIGAAQLAPPQPKRLGSLRARLALPGRSDPEERQAA